MPDTFTITVIFIVLAALVAAFVRRIKTDKCLKDFSNNLVTLQQTSNRAITGLLSVESTGLEFVYSQKQKNDNGHDEASFILYKYEYPSITVLVRCHDQLSEANKRQREKELKKTYHPGPLRRLNRKVKNIFKTVRDSILEVLNMLMAQAKKTTGAGAVLTSQDKYVSAMKKELAGSVGTSFEPLLEKYIGHKVVLEMIKDDKIFKYHGVLKDYTSEFVEIMDIDYKADEKDQPRKADIVVPRKSGIVRHLGE